MQCPITRYVLLNYMENDRNHISLNYVFICSTNISVDTHEQRGSGEFLRGRSWMCSALGRQPALEHKCW